MNKIDINEIKDRTNQAELLFEEINGMIETESGYGLDNLQYEVHESQLDSVVKYYTENGFKVEIVGEPISDKNRAALCFGYERIVIRWN